MGSRIHLKCNIESIPAVSFVAWQKMFDSTIKNVTSEVPVNKFIRSSNSLVIKAAALADSGQYRCIAINTVGTGESNQIYLTVYKGI